jgi:hypothetical protein
MAEGAPGERLEVMSAPASQLQDMLICMRTTILLPDELYRATKRRAAEEDRTMTSFIEEALRARLALGKEHDTTPFTVDAFVGSGVLPGVDLASGADLLERMEA